MSENPLPKIEDEFKSAVNTGVDIITLGTYDKAEEKISDLLPEMPEFPGPTEEELSLMSAQERAIATERLKGARADSMQRTQARKQKAGQIGLRSLLSGGFGGYGLGG